MYKVNLRRLSSPGLSNLICGWPQRVRHSESSRHQSKLSRPQLESGGPSKGLGPLLGENRFGEMPQGEQRQMKKHFCPLMRQIVERVCQETQTVSPLRSHCTHVPKLPPLSCSVREVREVCGEACMLIDSPTVTSQSPHLA